jgi:type III secretion protein J
MYVPFMRGRALLGLGLMLTSCSVPIAANLDEADANQAVTLLEQSSVTASKERDPEHEGRYRITVLNADAATAIGLLSRESLPPRAAPGVLEALGEGSVIPSRLAEQARWTAGVAGDLERSLRSLDGVLTARVHLAVPVKDSLEIDAEPEKPSASVLLRYRNVNPPIAAAEVQRLVAGAVTGLKPEQVNVVMTPSPAARLTPTDSVRIGPLSVSRGAGSVLRASAALVVLLNLLLLSGIAYLWARLRKSEGALVEARAKAEAGPAPNRR